MDAVLGTLEFDAAAAPARSRGRRARRSGAPCAPRSPRPGARSRFARSSSRSYDGAMIGRLNHVAIAVPDLAAAAALYRDTLGAKVSAPLPLPEHGVTTVFVELPNTKIELLEPLGESSPIAAFLERNPAGGIHHICYEVDDIRAAAAIARGDRRARPRRRRAEDRRARQAGGLPPPEGFPRHADRAGAGVSAMPSAASSPSISSSGGSCSSPSCPSACARRTRRARSSLGTDAERAGAPACSSARRSPPRSSRRSSSVVLWLAVERLRPRRRGASPTGFELRQAIKKARPFGLAPSVPRLNPSCRTHRPTGWSDFSRARRLQPNGAPEGIFLPRLRPRCLFIGAGCLVGHSRPLLMKKP